MNKYNFRKENAPKVAESLTPESFITRYFDSVESFKSMITDLDEFVPNYRSDLESCINYVGQGHKINSAIRWKRNQRTDMPYMRFSISLWNGDIPLMIVDHDNLASFLREYQDGAIKTGFSYNDLINYVNS